MAGDVGLEADQRGFDLFALGFAAVVRLFGEQCIDPLTIRNDFRTDRQRGEVAVGGHVVQRLVMQFIGVEEDLQAG
ncbi:hypothetical protein D3C86_1368160 [compost metagenome]